MLLFPGMVWDPRRDRVEAGERGGTQASLVAFDLLRLDGDDLRLRPIEARREALLRLVAKRRSDGFLFSEGLLERFSYDCLWRLEARAASAANRVAAFICRTWNSRAHRTRRPVWLS